MTPFEGSYLERYPEPGGPAERIPLLTLPFTIGRAESANHTIYSNKVSKEHAAIVVIGGHLAVRDLESTNGTFVNGRRIGEQILADGDIIHVAHVEFCFRQQDVAHATTPVDEDTTGHTVIVAAESRDSVIRATQLIRELIATEAVEILYQPIVELPSRRVVAYEALGRGAHPDLDTSPPCCCTRPSSACWRSNSASCWPDAPLSPAAGCRRGSNCSSTSMRVKSRTTNWSTGFISLVTNGNRSSFIVLITTGFVVGLRPGAYVRE